MTCNTEKARRPDQYRTRLALTIILAGLLTACTQQADRTAISSTDESGDPTINVLTPEEEAAGWVLLFSGSSLAGWRGLGRDHVPEGHWRVEDGTIHKIASGDVPTAADGQPLEGGDLMTEAVFGDFELQLEWKVSPGANSGVKYNVSEDMSTSSPPEYAALGFEYQILDDERHPDAANGPNRTAAALYDLVAPSDSKTLKPAGEFNSSRIVLVGNRGEHWLNGQLEVEYEIGSSTFDSLLAASKYQPIPGFAERREGHIVLQDHGDDVWFRNIKIRDLGNTD